jgi:hypothetical protein
VNDIDILSGMIRHGHAYEPVFKEDGYGDEGDDYEEGDGMDDEKIDKDADEVAEEELIDVDTGMSTKNKKPEEEEGHRHPRAKVELPREHVPRRRVEAGQLLPHHRLQSIRQQVLQRHLSSIQ